MIICPNCKNRRLRQFKYHEGVIYICNVCRLQWGNVDKSNHGGFITSPNEHYLNPDSLEDPFRYTPYSEFFTTLGNKKGMRSLRILDIGCGGGGFISVCLNRGHDAWGVEANSDLVRFMDKATRTRVHFGLAEEFKCKGDPFDVITFWDSFEHLGQSFDLLDRLKTNLKSHGIVYLRVNNNWDIFNILTLLALRINTSIGKKLLKVCFNFPDHCWNFSRQAMHDMLETRGWKIIKVKIGETPASRLTSNRFFRSLIQMAYLVNSIICGGKIGNYYIEPTEKL